MKDNQELKPFLDLKDDVIKSQQRLLKKSLHLNKKILWMMKFNFIYDLCLMILFLLSGVLIGVTLQ